MEEGDNQNTNKISECLFVKTEPVEDEEENIAVKEEEEDPLHSVDVKLEVSNDDQMNEDIDNERDFGIEADNGAEEHIDREQNLEKTKLDNQQTMVNSGDEITARRVATAGVELVQYKSPYRQRKYYKCQFVCGNSFYTARQLGRHEEFCPKGLPRCAICSKKFKSERSLTTHIFKIHGRTCEPDRQFICTFCDCSFRYKRNLTRHNKTFHSSAFDENICGENKVPYKKKVVCDICTKEVPYFSLARHKRNHGKFVCGSCGKAYSRKYNLKIHEKIVHEGITPQRIPCELCAKLFNTNRAYNHHLKTVHIGVTPKKTLCEFCSKLFCNSSSYRKHLRTVHKMSEDKKGEENLITDQ